MHKIAILGMSLTLLLLSGCGQTGPLYFPGNPSSNSDHQKPPLPHPDGPDFSAPPT